MFRKFGVGKTLILAALLLAAIVLFVMVTFPSCGAKQDTTAATAAPAQAGAGPKNTAASVTVPPEASASPSPSAAASPSPAPSPTPKASAAPAAAAKPAVKPTAKPTASPAQKPQEKPLSGKIIGIDPGHQAKADHSTEPEAPGSSVMKAKVSSGTQGRYSRVPEYKVTLQVGLLLEKLLKDQGATVVMTRTANDVNISNVERAKVFNKAKVDLGIRLHCNGSTDPDVHGAFMLVPKSKSQPYYDECLRAARLILKAYGKETGIDITKGITYRSDQTGFNWSDRPVTNIEMGHMTNKTEDYKLTDADFQKKMAQGIANGILAYFEE